MRALRIGYILTLSFILILMVITGTLGFFPPPVGPKAPEYPSSSPTGFSATGQDLSNYQNTYNVYNQKLKIYQEEQKQFIKDKIIPYTRNIFVFWIIIIATLQVWGIMFAKFRAEIVGAAYVFSGIWAVIFGPLGGLLWFLNSLISGLARKADEQFSLDPIFQAVSIASLIAILTLTFLGLSYFKKIKTESF